MDFATIHSRRSLDTAREPGSHVRKVPSCVPGNFWKGPSLVFPAGGGDGGELGWGVVSICNAELEALRAYQPLDAPLVSGEWPSWWWAQRRRFRVSHLCDPRLAVLGSPAKKVWSSTLCCSWKVGTGQESSNTFKVSNSPAAQNIPVAVECRMECTLPLGA